jgi:hypothetical protein
MAMGLGLLGRGTARQAVRFGGIHVLGAVLGGALTGGLLGGVGALLGLAAWRPGLVGVGAVAAVGLGLSRRPVRLGRQCQVPRAWGRTMPPRRRYFLWGLLLGCGVATPILSSAFLVLLGAQLTAGVLLGGVAGAVFGATREALALLPGLRGDDPQATMALLPRLRPTVRRLNALVALGGGLALVLAAWR